jgi:hypothetical protein
MRFANVGIHVPIFLETRGRCEWCQSKRKRTKMVGREKQEVLLDRDPTRSAKGATFTFVFPRNVIVSKNTTIRGIINLRMPIRLYTARTMILSENLIVICVKRVFAKALM